MRRSTAAVILDASLEVRGAIVYASLIEALVAMLPVFFLTGPDRRVLPSTGHLVRAGGRSCPWSSPLTVTPALA